MGERELEDLGIYGMVATPCQKDVRDRNHLTSNGTGEGVDVAYSWSGSTI